MRSVNREVAARNFSGGDVSIRNGCSCVTAAGKTGVLINCAWRCGALATSLAGYAESKNSLHALVIQAGVTRGRE
jgi:hypothetical protein